MRFLWTIALAAAVAAAEEDWQKQLEAEKKAREADRKEFEKRLNALEAQKSRDMLHAEVEEYLAQRDLFEAGPAASRGGIGNLIEISAILDVTVGGSTASDAALNEINLGDHDPKVSGFNVRNEELVVSADIDPYFYGLLDVVYKINEEGESELELEEAYAATTSLPASLQFKIGQYFTEFGRVNPVHPHAWEFVNFPVILARVFGPDGWRGQGARISCIAPTGFPMRLLVGAQNARGETEASFLGEEGEMVGAYTLMNRSVSGLGDLAWNARIEASHDLASCASGARRERGFRSRAARVRGRGARRRGVRGHGSAPPMAAARVGRVRDPRGGDGGHRVRARHRRELLTCPAYNSIILELWKQRLQ